MYQSTSTFNIQLQERLQHVHAVATQHNDRRRQCIWTPLHLQAVEFGHTMLTQEQWNKETEETWLQGISSAAPDVYLHRCTVKLSNGDIFLVDRVGPFETIGGWSWNRWQLQNVCNTSAYPKHISLTASSIVVIDDEGRVIPFPPLHPHHWHLNTPRAPYLVKPYHGHGAGHMVGQTHGDSMCKPADGGVECYYQTSPDGYGRQIVSNRLAAWGETNDVRSSSSPILRHFIEVSATISSRFLVATGAEGFGNVPWVYPDWEFSRTMSLKVPAGGQQSVHWKNKTFQHCFTIVNAGWHTHHILTSDIWLLRGSGSELGLNQFPLPNLGEALNLASLGLTHAHVKQQILIQTRADTLVCSLAKPSHRFEYVSQDYFAKGTLSGIYGRGVPTCPDIKVRANETLTLVAFFGPTGISKPLCEIDAIKGGLHGCASGNPSLRQHVNLGGSALMCDTDKISTRRSPANLFTFAEA